MDQHDNELKRPKRSFWAMRVSQDGHVDRDGEAGFTLLEVIVVISIIGLIMGMVGPRVLGYLSDSKLKTARIQAETLSNAAELFFIDNSRYPLDNEGLQALVKAPASLPSWHGPYLRGNSVPLDPWGRPYLYNSPDRGHSYAITFTGADGQAVPAQAGGGTQQAGRLQKDASRDPAQ